MFIYDFLKSIPDVIWSGVIASLLTLGGVLLSNKSNTDRLKIQLKHDGEEKAKERVSTLRREVYLKATEELVKLNSNLGSLPQQDLSKVNVADFFIKFQAASARLQLVAEPKTALHAMKLSAVYTELFIELMQHLIPINKAKIDIDNADKFFNKSNSEVQRILSAISNLIESGIPNEPALHALQENLNFHQHQLENYASESRSAWKDFNTASIPFRKHLLNRLREIAALQMTLTVHIRRDLSLSDDLQEVEKEMQIQLTKIEKKLDEFISYLNTTS